MGELCDIYDICGNKTGEVFARGELLKNSEYQLVTNIWIINNKYQILIQKRAESKETSPNIWATHGGGVAAGETSLNGCIREAYEEIGIIVISKDIKPLTRIISNNLIMDSYITTREFNISSSVLQVEEVSDLRWVSLDELDDMIKSKFFYEYQELPFVKSFINSFKLAR